MKKYLKLSLGWVLLGIGFVGLFLPFLQGLLLMGVGASLLSSESDQLKAFIQRVKKKVSDRMTSRPSME